MPGAFVAGKMVIHLGVQGAFGQRLLQRIQQAALLKRRARSTSRQQLVEKIVRYRRLFASRPMGSPFYPLCPPTHVIPDSPDHWAHINRVTLDFSRPGKPTDNAFVESCSGRLRGACLNTHWFLSLDDARAKLEAWRWGLQ